MTATAVCQECHWEGPEGLLREDRMCVSCGSDEVCTSELASNLPIPWHKWDEFDSVWDALYDIADHIKTS